MKFLIKVLLGLLVLVLFAVIAVSLVFYYSPGLQKRILVGFLQTDEETTVELEYFRAGFRATHLRDLLVQTGEESLSLDSVEADYAFWSLLSGQPEIHSLKINGLVIDIAATGGSELFQTGKESPKVTVSASTSEPAETGGAFPFRIDAFHLDGILRLPENSNVQFETEIQNLRPGSTAEISAIVSLQKDPTDLILTNAQARLTATLSQSESGMPEKFAVKLDELSASRGTQSLTQGGLQADGSLGQDDQWQVQFSGDFQSDLAVLTSLPMISSTLPVLNGRLTAGFSGTSDPEVSIDSRLSIQDLRPEGYAGKPYAINLEPSLTMTEEPATVILVSSINLEGPGTPSKGSLMGDFKQVSEQPLQFDIELSLDYLDLDAWQPLINAFSSTSPVEPETPPDATPDTAPPWDQLVGKARLAVDELLFGGNSLQGISATVSLSEEGDLSASVEGRSFGAPMAVDANLDFDPSRPASPYTLTGDFDVREFTVTPFFRKSQSTGPVLLEGAFNVNGNFQSQAPNPLLLVEDLRGQLLLESSGNGIFRPLGEQTSMATGVSGLLGSLTGNVRELGWVQLVIDQLQEIPYSRMRFQVERDENLSFVVRDLDLVSRETRLRGSGVIQYDPSVPLLQTPIDLNLELFAKGRLAEALRTGNQLRSGQPDNLGFLPGPPLPIRGTLAQPESLFVNLLMETGTQQLLPGLLRNLNP